MVRQAGEDVFAQLARVVDKMKHESTFRKKTKSEEVVSSEEHLKPEKRIAKKHPDAKPRKSKIKSRRMLKKPAVQKPLRMPLAVLIKKHERQKIKAKIENAIVKNEAKKIRDVEDFGKLGLKRIITKKKTFCTEPVHLTSAKKVVSIEENEKLAKAIQLMLKNDIRGLAVTSGSELKGAVESEDIIQKLEGASTKHAETLMSMPVKELARPAATVEKNVSLGSAIRQMEEKNANRVFITEDEKPVGVISKSDVLERVVQSGSNLSRRIETGIDKLLELVEQHGKISIDEASKLLDVDIKLVEEWASILDDHDLIRIEYPIIGAIELVKK